MIANSDNTTTNDQIKNVLDNYVQNYENGLFLLELPTSIGKTYSTFDWIAQYTKNWSCCQNVKQKKTFKQVIFVTSMKKNLMTTEFNKKVEIIDFENDEYSQLGDLEKAYQRHGRLDAYKDEVMVVKSKADIMESILSFLDNKDNGVPFEYRTLPQMDKLRKNINKMLGSAAKSDKEYYDLKLKDANSTYFKLRKEVANVYKTLKGIERKQFVPLSQVAEDGNPWIYTLFPDLLIPKKKVLLMSFSELLMGRMYEGKIKSFLSDGFLKNKIIFIDEFDSTKKTLKDTLAENYSLGEENDTNEEPDEGYNHPFNFLQMFVQIYRGSRKLCASEELVELANDSKINGKVTQKNIISESERLNEKFLLDHAYLPDDKLKDKNKSVFIFQDYATRTILNGSYYGRIVAAEKKGNRVILSIKKSSEMEDDDFYVDGVIRWLKGFINRFSFHTMNVGRAYAEVKNAANVDKPEAELSDEEGFRSYLSKFYISRAENKPNFETKMLWNMAVATKTSFYFKNKKNVMGYDYYIDGFTYYNIESRKSDNDSVILYMVNMPQTAEGIMAKICSKALTFGISATAMVSSVTGAYNLPWIKEFTNEVHDIVGENPKLKEWVQDFLDKRYKPYEDGKIEIKLTTMPNLNNFSDDIISAYLNGSSSKNPCLALNKFEGKIAWEIEKLIIASLQKYDKDDISYEKMRYYNLANVMRDFATKTNIQSLLYVGKKNAEGDPNTPPNGKYAFDKFVITKIVKYVNKDLNLDNDNKIGVAFVYSEDFNKTMADIKFRLSDKDLEGKPKTPERLIIVSSYDSIGVGQNMQYPAPEKFKKDLVRLIPRGQINEKTYEQKDIDAIYLGDITYLTAVFGIKKLTEKELISAIFQAEELNASGEISSEDKENHIVTAFNNRYSILPRKNELKDAESIKSERSRTVIQSVGRIGRSNQRCKEINVYIDNNVIDRLHSETLCQRFMTPEIKMIADKCLANISPIVQTENAKDLIMSNTISDKAAEDINSMLGKNASRGEWITEDMKEWQNWRLDVMKYPTATKEEKESSVFLNSYMLPNLGNNSPEYLFSVNNRYYGHQRVWWGDENSFKKAEKSLRPYTSKGNIFDSQNNEVENIMRMSEKNSGLPVLLKYNSKGKSLRAWWVEQGFATSFENKPYVLCPFLYTEILKGCYGETAGKFILETETDLMLEDIVNPKHFEKADFKVTNYDGWFVDFKHYSLGTQKDNKQEAEKAFNKLNFLGGKKMIIANLIKRVDYNKIDSFYGGRIVVIPWLIDEDGQPNPNITKVII